MRRDSIVRPLWTGFLELVRSIFVIEIGVCLFYSLGN